MAGKNGPNCDLEAARAEASLGAEAEPAGRWAGRSYGRGSLSIRNEGWIRKPPRTDAPSSMRKAPLTNWEPRSRHVNRSKSLLMSLLAYAKNLATSTSAIPTSWYAIPLRIVVGFGFMQHGYAKLARGPEEFINILHLIGVPFSFLLGLATIVVELIGGLFILLGAFVPLTAVPMIVILVVAIFSVHLPNGFSSIKLQSFDAAGAHFGQPGYETDLLYVAALVALCLGGPGPMSVNSVLSQRRSTATCS